MIDLVIPADLLPKDGRFGSGPAKVRSQQVQAIGNSNLLGTSHRKPGVRQLVGDVRAKLLELFAAPADYEVVLGNGGSTAFWAAATASLVRTQAVHAAFGEFGAKFATETSRAPFLLPTRTFTAPPGELARVSAVAGADVYAWPHHETSTGVLSPVGGVAGADPDALVVIDATSIAGGIEVGLAEVDVYYFAPQKAFGSDGGLWFAIMSPRAIARIEEIAAGYRTGTAAGDSVGPRWMPDFLSLEIALTNSRKDQTLNTPAIATLAMLDSQLDWMLAEGGLNAMAERCRRSTSHLYAWATERPWATPFVTEPAWRSPVVATIDFVGVSAPEVSATLRAHGVVDVDPYRKLGRNQLRIGVFPSVDPEDVFLLTKAIDHVVGQLAE